MVDLLHRESYRPQIETGLAADSAMTGDDTGVLLLAEEALLSGIAS